MHDASRRSGSVTRRRHSAMALLVGLPLVWSGCMPGDENGYEADAPLAAAVDTVVDVGGHRLHLRVREGTVPLTVLFEAGGAADLTSWGEVDGRLAERSRLTIVSYDRAGLGGSEFGPLHLTPMDEVRTIRRAIDRLGLPRRMVVVGHSYGALMAMAHGVLFPDEVVGTVLVDPMNPRFIALQGDWLSSTVPDTTVQESDRDRVVARMTRTLGPFSERLSMAETAMEVPMIVVTAGEPWWGSEAVDEDWRRSHEAMVTGHTDRRLIVADGSKHDIPGTKPNLIVDAILSLVDETSAPEE